MILPNGTELCKPKTHCFVSDTALPDFRHNQSAITNIQRLFDVMQDVRRFHQKFYADPNRLAQHNFILRHVTVETPKRRRSHEGNDEYHRKQVTIKYFIPSLCENEVTNVPVCKNLFVNTLKISKDRVQNICKKFLETGEAPLEARGGDKKSVLYTGRKQAVKTFIEKIPVLESHYCRGKNIHCQYLSSKIDTR